jgi:hypothetical protein
VGLVKGISTGTLGVGCGVPDFLRTGIVVAGEGTITIFATGVIEEGERFKFRLGAESGVGFFSAGFKKGNDRMPQPGILTTQPVEISKNTSNIADKMDRLFKVSRNRTSLGRSLCQKSRNRS